MPRFYSQPALVGLTAMVREALVAMGKAPWNKP